MPLRPGTDRSREELTSQCPELLDETQGMARAIRMEGGGQTMLEGNLLGPGLRTTVACDEDGAALEGDMVVE